jgi:hypothetical protein
VKRSFTAPAVVAFLFAGTGHVRGNGYEFFTVDRAHSVKLAYVGQIREKATGRIVREPAYFMVTEKRSGMTFPFVNDRPGHYRSPDIGQSVEELAATAVDPKDLEFELAVTGYKSVTLTKAPRKNKGIVEVNFLVERETANPSSGAPQATPEFTDLSIQAKPPADDAANDARSRSFRLIFMGVAAVAMIGGGAARTLGRRQRQTHPPISGRESWQGDTSEGASSE